MTFKQLLGKLAWLPVPALNLLASYLVVSYVRTQFRTADSNVMGSIVGWGVLVLYLLVELVFIVAVAAVLVTRKEASRG